MRNQDLEKQLTTPSKNSRLEKFGKGITFFCLVLIVFIVAMIFNLVPQKRDYQLSLSMVLIQSHSSLEVSGIQVQDHLELFR